jgi:hypothetical protein
LYQQTNTPLQTAWIRRGPVSSVLINSSCPLLEFLTVAQSDLSHILPVLSSSLPSLVHLDADYVFEIDDISPRWAPSPAEWIAHLSDAKWCPKLRSLKAWTTRRKSLKILVNGVASGDGARVPAYKESEEREEIMRLCAERKIRLLETSGRPSVVTKFGQALGTAHY